MDVNEHSSLFSSPLSDRKVCRTQGEKFLLITNVTLALPQLSEKASTFPVAANSGVECY